MQTVSKHKDPFYGAIADTSSELDYQLAAGELELPVAPLGFKDNKIQYHQPNVSKVSCTVFAAMGCVSDLTAHVFSLPQQRKIWAMAIEQGANPEVGWYIHKAVDLVRNFCNDELKMDLVTFRVDMKTDDVFYALDKGYSIDTGFRGNRSYNKDITDGTLDGLDFGLSTYGHSVRVVPREDGDLDIVVDNYIESKKEKNTYRVDRNKFNKLVSNGVFFRWGYVFAKKDDVSALNKEGRVSPWALKSVQKAKESGLAIDWENPQLEMNNEIIKHYLFKLGVLDSVDGVLTKERWTVALDRLGLL